MRINLDWSHNLYCGKYRLMACVYRVNGRPMEGYVVLKLERGVGTRN
jgi:hypothetical protein